MDVYKAAKSIPFRDVIIKYTGQDIGHITKSTVINCPYSWHRDGKPSFSIDPPNNRFNCFGCNISGSQIDFVLPILGFDPHMDKQSEAYKEAIKDTAKIMCQDFNIPYDDIKVTKDPEYEDYISVYNWVADFFVRCNKYDNALDYWVSRKLDTLINEYKLGYCPAVFRDKTNTVVTFKYILTKKFPHIPVEVLDSYNLYDSYGQCLFTERYMFAIHDKRGNVIAFSGRTAVNDPAKYKNSRETKYFQKKKVLYNYHKAKNYPSIYVVEGQADALSLVAAGVPNVVASLGTAFTTEHIDMLDGKEIILAFDNDDAGHSQMLKLLLDNADKKLAVQDIFFGQYKDFNEALCNSIIDLKSFLSNNKRMHGPDYLLKLFCANACKLNKLKSDKNKTLEESVRDLEQYEILHQKDIYLDLSDVDDRVKVHDIISKASKFYKPVIKDNIAVRLQRLIKGRRIK